MTDNIQFHNTSFSSSLTLREIFSGQSNIFEKGWSLPAKYYNSMKTPPRDTQDYVVPPLVTKKIKFNNIDTRHKCFKEFLLHH
jgi:hypothetical protein